MLAGEDGVCLLVAFCGEFLRSVRLRLFQLAVC